MASYSAGCVIAPFLLTTSLYQRFGRRGAAQIALVVMSSALLLYAMAYFIPDQHRFLFCFASAVTRVLEGMGSGGSMAAIMSLFSNVFPQ